HREIRYDAVYQFSQPELLGLRRHLTELPPVVLHPQVHAAGELRWHRNESVLSAGLEPAWKRATVRAVLTARAAIQRRDLALAAGIVAASELHAGLLVADSRAEQGRLHVVPNPIDLTFFAPRPAARAPGPHAPVQPVQRIVFVSRLSVRKGVEMVAELSRRLSDLRGAVSIEIVGFPTGWSDYSGLIKTLDPMIVTHAGQLSGPDLLHRYQSADLCVVPSHYEPFGLTAAESLACGTPVVASDAVGAVENLDATCCVRFAAGDAAGLEAAVRCMLTRMRINPSGVRADARKQAVARFDPRLAGRRLAQIIRQVTRAGS
ncbi:MAG TPA: glycosyltransferase family 4 protein, partial [Solirubrobacteraceae bacterium]|nr:glycosyltransferase family 4 protein [Solirubrobacteraceae bacterium]